MKKYLPLIFFFFAGSVQALERPDFVFDRAKIAQADDAFALYRSTADYFYALLDRNRDGLQTIRTLGRELGWCAGDPHPENFGALILADGGTMFTLDDMDDAGPCPLIMDLERLMVGAKFVAPANVLPAYLAGTRGETRPAPRAVRKLLKKSLERGREPDPDDLPTGSRLTRRKSSREVRDEERERITTALGERPLDVYATAKCGGGSHGLLRYEVLLGNPKRVLELKSLDAPAVTRVSPRVPPAEERIARTLDLEQDGRADASYRVVRIADAPMLQRPRFHGNVNMKIFELETAERAEVLEYEAYRLGQLHARSRDGWAPRLDPTALEADVDALYDHFQELFVEFRRDRNYRSDCSPPK